MPISQDLSTFGAPEGDERGRQSKDKLRFLLVGNKPQNTQLSRIVKEGPIQDYVSQFRNPNVALRAVDLDPTNSSGKPR
jgi:hypothetical protein